MTMLRLILMLFACFLLTNAASYADHSTAGPNIPLKDYENFHYFAIQLKNPSSIIHGSLNNFYVLGNVGELKDYYLVATRKQPLVEAHTHQKRLSESFDDIVYIKEQVPRRVYGKQLVEETDIGCLNNNKLKKRDPAQPPRNKELFKKLGINDPEFEKQWHLYNFETIGNDINVTGVWIDGYFGKNVSTCFIDDGLDYTHPDLKDNFYGEGSYDFNGHQKLPTPQLSDDRHGTRCAGEVAAKRNDVCGIGIAWDSKVSGVRILSGDLTEADEAAAINYDYHNNHIYSCSWGPSDNGQAMDAPPKIVADAFTNGILYGRNGLGSLFIFATGNGGSLHDNCNFDGYTNSIYTITVGAIDKYNNHPEYSEECSAQLVVTYSSGSGGHIHTSDWPTQCTTTHGGTSAAAPIASGIYALVMSVRPDFTWRDFQHVSVQSAVPVQKFDPSWSVVAKDRLYSHKYGYGKLDAYGIVQLSLNHTLVNPQTRIDVPQIIVDNLIPKNTDGLTSEVVITTDMIRNAMMKRLEHITVTVTITHPKRGDVRVILTSPNGYESILATKRDFDSNSAGFQNWTFMSVKHWEENPIGKWKLQILDAGGNNGLQPGKLKNWYFTLFGESALDGIVIPPPSTPIIEMPPTITNEPISTETPPADIIKSSNALMAAFALLGFLIVVGASIYIWRREKRKVNDRSQYKFEELDDERMLNSTFADYDDEDILFEDDEDIELGSI